MGLSETGLSRTENQDCYQAKPTLAVLCDGMGGHDDGALASKHACIAAGAEHACQRGESLPEQVRAMFDSAHCAVRALAKPGRPRPPGTTMVVALRLGRRYVVGHVGDSRCYLLGPDGRLARRLTADHGSPTGITAYVGGPRGRDPDVLVEVIPSAHHLLLTTDGVHGVIDVAEVCARVAAHAPTTRLDVWRLLSKEIRSACLLAGAPDNFSAVIASL